MRNLADQFHVNFEIMFFNQKMIKAMFSVWDQVATFVLKAFVFNKDDLPCFQKWIVL